MDYKRVKRILEIIRKKVWIFFLLIIVGLLFLYYLFIPASKLQENEVRQTSKTIQEGIAGEIIRFHVIANSDSTEDQNLKIKVKNAIVEGLKEPLQRTNTISEARKVIVEEMPLIEKIASDIITSEGYQYEVNANLSDTYFPTKIYGDMTFPPGIYEALRVEIGDAKGKNWWCVMFPPLCFVDGTYSVVPEDSKEKLKYVLTEDEYTSLMKKGKVKVKAKFKLKEVFEDLF